MYNCLRPIISLSRRKGLRWGGVKVDQEWDKLGRVLDSGKHGWGEDRQHAYNGKWATEGQYIHANQENAW